MRRLATVVVVALLMGSLLNSPHTANGDAVNVSPTRLLDTREGHGAPLGRLMPGVTLTLPVPASLVPNATTVALNLTATEALGAGFVTAWPCEQAQPATSNLNVVPTHTDANLVVVGLGDGAVCLSASTPVHLVADLMGGFTGSVDFRAGAPTRILDTRQTVDRIGRGEERRISVAAGTGFSTGARAVAMNITVVNPSAAGFVVIYPCGDRPLASTVNFNAGEIVPNFTITSMDKGEICAFASVATDLVIDTFGWSDNTAGLRSQAPSRLLDTRSGDGWAGGAVNSNDRIELRVAGLGGVPLDARGALVTITATEGVADGFVTMWPCDEPRPLTSVLNLRSGLLRSNLTFAPLSAVAGSVCIFVQTVDGSRVHLVADAVGWTTGGPARTSPPGPPTTTPGGGPGGGGFSDSFSGDLSNWSISRWRQEGTSSPGFVGPAETVCGVANALPPHDVGICNGRLVVSNASKNYGDLFLRADQQFDVAGRTGTVTFDVTTHAEPLEGYPVLLFTDGPYSAPSYNDDNAFGPGPKSGLLVQFNSRCVLNGQWVPFPQVRTWSNYVMSTATGSGCAGTMNSETTLDHVVVKVSTGAIDITVNGQPWYHASVGVPARSFVHIGVHNHATSKYGAMRAAWTSMFDNFAFDGPVLPVGVSEVADPLTPDAGGINVAYSLPTPALTLANVPASPAAAFLTLSMQANRGADLPSSRLNYRLNGHQWHSLQVQDIGVSRLSSSFTWQIQVDVSELVAGSNTVEFAKTGFDGGWPAAVANIDLVTL